MGRLATVNSHDLPADPRPQPSSLRRLLGGLASRLGSSALDRQLAAGVDPSATPALSRRATQLVSDRQRERMAESITRILAASRRSDRYWSTAIDVNRTEILAAHPSFLRIEGILLSADPIYCQGIAMLRRLLTDGSSPIYTRCPPGILEGELGVVIGALEGARVR